MSAFESIDHVQLAMPAGEEHTARDFYAGLLGMTEVVKPVELRARGGAWFSSGDVIVHLGVDPDFRPARKAHPAFRCAAYRELVERLRAAGVAVTQDGVRIAGHERCYVSDPFGNRIELIDARSS